MSSDVPEVRHRATRPFDYSTLIDDAATFYINNKVYEGFKNIRLSRNLMSLTGSFEITLTDKWRVDKEDFDIKTGDRIHCHLGKNPLYEGYIDSLSISLSSTSRNLTISGRDKTADLVDCSIIGPAEYNNLDFLGIAKKLVEPFGLKVLSNVDVGKKFAKFSIKQGETIFEALERAAKERELLLMSTTHGNLLIDKKGSQRASSELVEGVNVLSAGAVFDNSERFSEYHVKGQQSGLIGDITDATESAGKSTDKGVLRHRPTLIISENAVDQDGAQKRAQFESSLRAAQATKVSIVVQGWRQKDGSLWNTNLITHVDCRSIGIKSDMLISRVKFDQGTGGRRTEMELIRKDAFEFKKEIKKSDDPIDSLGWGV
ncbi:MAG: hypothetical protein IMF01_09310 [Proteobacteria bacterium]|nr:hypothetical protein [Pseudomonadota bacterium]